MKWEKVTLDKLGTISRGKSKHRPRNDPSLFGGEFPFIQTSDIKNATFYITDYTDTYNEKGLSQSKLWEPDTLCITIAANIADTAILGIKACFPDSVMGFISYEGVSDVRFVKYSFDILQSEMKQISQGTAQDNLSFDQARQQVENMTALSQEQTDEIIVKIDEIEAISKEKTPKKKKWEKIKPILAFALDKGVDIVIMLWSLALQHGFGQ